MNQRADALVFLGATGVSPTNLGYHDSSESVRLQRMRPVRTLD